jgi:pimeloyl-ACP methyl ester carboxylesterase
MAHRESILFEFAVERRKEPDPAPVRAVSATLTRRYVGEAGRQVHLIEGVQTLGADPTTPLACLHATPSSSSDFMPFLSAMAPRRHVLALDTPGYGASDRPEQRLDIAGYARALGEALDLALASGTSERGGGPIDLFGHSTGALLAVELARQRPEQVRRLVLMGVPYFIGAEQAVWRHRLARPHGLSDDLSPIEEKWRKLVVDREWGVSLERGFDAFVDELRAYPSDWWAHDAAFAFDVETAFAEVRQPVLILNPANGLAQASRRAAWALPDGRLVDLPRLHNAPFDVGAEDLVERMDAFLRNA